MRVGRWKWLPATQNSNKNIKSEKTHEQASKATQSKAKK